MKPELCLTTEKQSHSCLLNLGFSLPYSMLRGYYFVTFATIAEFQVFQPKVGFRGKGEVFKLILR